MDDIIDLFILNLKNLYTEIEKICDTNNINIIVKNEILDEIKNLLPKGE